MVTLRIAEIAPFAGPANDGIVRGRIAQSPLLAAWVGVLQAGSLFALRRDINGSDTFADVSAQAVGTAADGFMPWGTDATFSAQDELWLAAEKNICAVYIELTTPGAWTGTGISVMESVNGETLVPVANLSDGSNGLRAAAGVYRIAFEANEANRRAISPIFGGTKRRYVVLRPNGFSAKTTAPKLRRVWLVCADDGITYSDLLPTLSGAMGSSDFSAAPGASHFPVVGDVVYYALPALAIGVDDAIYRRTQNRTGIYEYLAADATWKALAGISDSGDQLRNGPVTAGSTAERFALRWTIPTDWGAQPLTLPPAAERTAHWLRYRITAVTPYGAIQTPYYRRRARAFGPANASGIYHADAVVYSRLTYDLGVPPATDMIIQFANAHTGAARSVTIPAGIRSSSEESDGRADFASPLAIGAGEHLLVLHSAGGSASDCELRLS